MLAGDRKQLPLRLPAGNLVPGPEGPRNLLVVVFPEIGWGTAGSADAVDGGGAGRINRAKASGTLGDDDGGREGIEPGGLK